MTDLNRHHYYIFHKPYGVICQFSPSEGKATLAAYGPFRRGIYPVGRLDHDSEGLLLLTDDGALQHALLEPKFRHPRTYLAQVEGIPDAAALERLRAGVVIEQKKTLPAEVELPDREPDLQPRSVPIRIRISIPTAWIQLTIYEGRNRQVRKMTAAVGHPTLRLVRSQFCGLTIEGLGQGEYRELTRTEVMKLQRESSNRGGE